MYIYIYICIHVCPSQLTGADSLEGDTSANRLAASHNYKHSCMTSVCISIYIYIYVYTHTYIHT